MSRRIVSDSRLSTNTSGSARVLVHLVALRDLDPVCCLTTRGASLRLAPAEGTVGAFNGPGAIAEDNRGTAEASTGASLESGTVWCQAMRAETPATIATAAADAISATLRRADTIDMADIVGIVDIVHGAGSLAIPFRTLASSSGEGSTARARSISRSRSASLRMSSCIATAPSDAGARGRGVTSQCRSAGATAD